MQFLNGTAVGEIAIHGTGESTFGLMVANSLSVYNNGSTGLAFMADNAAGTIKFAAGGHPSIAQMTLSAAGNLGIGTTAPSSLLTVAGKAEFGDIIQSDAAAFASLPACSGSTEGAMRAVNNSTTNVWGATITGGGANHVLAYCDGTNWTVMAK